MSFPLDPLAVKRRRLTDIIVALNAERLRALQADPGIDVNVRAAFERGDRRQIERDVSRLNEQHLDDLLAHYAPDRRRYVW